MSMIEHKLAYLSMTCANPSDHLSAGLWCETANEAYMLAWNLWQRLQASEMALREIVDYGDRTAVMLAERALSTCDGADAQWRGVYPGYCIDPETCRGFTHCPRKLSCVE